MLVSLLTSFVCNLSCCVPPNLLFLLFLAFAKRRKKAFAMTNIIPSLSRVPKTVSTFYPRETFYDSNFCWEAVDDDNRQKKKIVLHQMLKLIKIFLSCAHKKAFSIKPKRSVKSKNRFSFVTSSNIPCRFSRSFLLCLATLCIHP